MSKKPLPTIDEFLANGDATPGWKSSPVRITNVAELAEAFRKAAPASHPWPTYPKGESPADVARAIREMVDKLLELL